MHPFAAPSHTRGYSLIELLSVLTLMAVLTGAGVMLFTGLRSSVSDDQALTKLRSVAAVQRQLYQQRGSFMTDPAALNTREGSALFTDGEATGGTISVAGANENGEDRLALATLTTDGACFVLITTRLDEDTSYRFEPAASRSCHAAGELA